MHYNEILEFLKNNGVSVDNFAYESSVDIPEDFVPSSKIQELREAKEKAYKEWQEYEDWQEYESKSSNSNNSLYKAWSDIPSVDDEIQKEYLESVGIGEIIEVEAYGGENMGSTWYSIKHFPKHDIYIRVDGWYQSHYGTDFEDWDTACSEVKPVKKTITTFE